MMQFLQNFRKCDLFSRVLLFFFFLAFSFSGLLSLSAIWWDYAVLKLWKEIILIVLITTFYCTQLLCKRVQISIVGSVAICAFILYFLYNIYNMPLEIVFYQLKNDALLLFFAIFVNRLFSLVDYQRLYSFIRALVQIVAIAAFFNAIAGLLELAFTQEFLEMINFTGKWGASTGVMLFINQGVLREIGLQLGFTSFATLMLFFLILLNESPFVELTRKKRMLLTLILVISIGLSTYYNAIVGMIIYFFLKFVNYKLREHAAAQKLTCLIFLSVFFIAWAFIMNTNCGFEMMMQIDPNKAEGSIGPRVYQHLTFLTQMANDGLGAFFTGLGWGVNGLFGSVEIVKSLGFNPMATDSVYAYLLSNYGLFGAMVVVFAYGYMYFRTLYGDYFGVKYMLFYTLGIEFFLNNAFTNFPVQFFLIMLYFLNNALQRYNIGIMRKEC